MAAPDRFAIPQMGVSQPQRAFANAENGQFSLPTIDSAHDCEQIAQSATAALKHRLFEGRAPRLEPIL
jgi:hypothetical protein